jgi:ATP-dependent exoDNAse (exonuclease V) beta subunit
VKSSRQAAITFVEAGAGSGKTYTLAQQMVRLLKEQPDLGLDQILLITFTNKAAEEMQAAVYRQLRAKYQEADADEKRRWHKLVQNFSANAIMTFDALFGRIVREAGFDQAIEPDFALLSNLEIQSSLELDWLRLRRQGQQYLRLGEPWLGFSAAIWQRLISQSDSETQLRRLVNACAGSHAKAQGFATVFDKIREVPATELWPQIRNNLLLPVYADCFSSIHASFEARRRVLAGVASRTYTNASSVKAARWLQQVLSDTAEVSDAVGTCAILFQQLPTKPRGNDAKPELADLIDELRRLAKYLGNGRDVNCIDALLCDQESPGWNELMQLVLAFAALVREFSTSSLRQRRQNNRFDFADVMSLSLHLLRQNGRAAAHLSRRYRQRYRAVFVDEFQDTDPRQFAILRHIFDFSRTDLFVVGDANQSIYRFRGADNQAMQHARKRLASESTLSVSNATLEQNYRSAPELIRYFNELFSRVFRSEKMHQQSSDKYLRQGIPATPGSPAGSGRLEIFHYPGKHPDWALLADHIAALYANRGDWQADYPWCGVLLPKTKYFRPLSRELEKRGVMHSVLNHGFYQQPELLTLLGLLTYLNQPQRPQAVISVLSGALVGLNDEQLARLHQEGDITTFFSRFREAYPRLAATLAKWLLWSQQLPLHICLWRIVLQSNFPDNCGDMAMGNVQLLLRHLNAHDLFSGLQQIEILRTQTNAECEVTDNNAEVQLLTIHKSKGLKFHQVITMTPDSGRGRNDPLTWMLTDWQGDAYGRHYFAVPQFFTQPGGKEKFVNPIHTAAAFQQRREMKDESCRLSYVAQTRAVAGLTVLNPQSEKNDAVETCEEADITTQLASFYSRFSAAECGFAQGHFAQQVWPEAAIESLPIPAPPPALTTIATADAAEDVALHISVGRLARLLSGADERIVTGDYEPGDSQFGTAFHAFMQALVEADFALTVPAPFSAHCAALRPIIEPLRQTTSLLAEQQLSLEYNMIIDGRRVTLTIDGIVDLICLTTDAGMTIFDYKTGNHVRREYFWQLRLYGWMLRELGAGQVENAALLMSHPDFAQPREQSIPTDILAADIEQKLQAALGQLLTDSQFGDVAISI